MQCFYRSGRDARFVFADAAVWPFVIPMLCALHAGQSIREVGPQWHNTKAGTPTMGGIMFIAAIILCTVGFGWKSMTENRDYTHLYVLALALCYGLVGFADDFVKVKLKRNLGLTAIQKFLLQLVVAVVFLFVLKTAAICPATSIFRSGILTLKFRRLSIWSLRLSSLSAASTPST